MAPNDVPPSVDTSHCTVGAGLPLAAAVNVADWPGRIVCVSASGTGGRLTFSIVHTNDCSYVAMITLSLMRLRTTSKVTV